MALHIPHWDRGSQTEQRHPGRWETALWADKGQSWAGRQSHSPDPSLPPLTWGCGQVDPLHDEQEHVVAAEVREDPSGRAGGETEVHQLQCLPASLPLAGPRNKPLAGLYRLLGSSFRIRQTGSSLSSSANGLFLRPFFSLHGSIWDLLRPSWWPPCRGSFPSFDISGVPNVHHPVPQLLCGLLYLLHLTFLERLPCTSECPSCWGTFPSFSNISGAPTTCLPVSLLLGIWK